MCNYKDLVNFSTSDLFRELCSRYIPLGKLIKLLELEGIPRELLEPIGVWLNNRKIGKEDLVKWREWASK